MKLFEKSLVYLLVATLLGTSASSEAVSLGRIRGATIVGRVLDVSIAALLEASEEAGSVCVEADVFFGDAKLPPGRVRITTEAGANPGEAIVRIRTTSAVDEPVVTVYLREGCGQKNTRKYVVLADVLADSAAQLPLPRVDGSVPMVALPPPAGRGAAAPGAASASAAAASEAAAPRRRAARSNPETSPAAPESRPPARIITPPAAEASARLTTKLAPVKPTRPRLKLDPVDLSIDRDPVLRGSSELLTAPATDEQQRAAAAALWQALNAQPQDVLRDSQRLKTLEADMASLTAQNRKTQQALADLRTDLEGARSERYNNWLVYLLAALLLLAIGTVALLWSRGQKSLRSLSAPWWRKNQDDDDPDVPQAPASGTKADAAGKLLATNPKGTAAAAAEPGLDLDLDLDLDMNEAMFDSLKFPQGAAQKTTNFRARAADEESGFSVSLPGIPRTVNAEELFDVQQQADFFISLGQLDQAVEVLQHHISDNVETSAVAYLDLFDLYHRLGRKEAYETLRNDFNRVFNAQVPVFESYTIDEEGLEAYPTALSRIQALWPTRKVLEIIEESVFRKPESGGDAFNLSAYRELLFLYAIAKDIVDRPQSDGMDFDLGEALAPESLDSSGFTGIPRFAVTNIQPLTAEVHDLPTLSDVLPGLPGENPDPTLPPSSPRLGIDIDLSFDADEAPKPVPPRPQTRRSHPMPLENRQDPPVSNMMEFDPDSISTILPWPKDK